ncbi:MAG: Mrp/NBP35 family ATP-binding protein [Candidatus Aenigmarchaeota archaeon]|nr:Mrp/NBP35 family ATP-binding protein [Candidatus Aenigmarchaeota archaeon]
MEGIMEFQGMVEEIRANLSGIGHKIAVMSGKGGVGKTTVAVNLAVSLAKKCKVSLLDADIDCPNVNKFLGIKERLTARGGKMVPVNKYGMSVVSFASLQESEDQPVIWRGPMLSKAIMELLGNVEWGKQDYLIVDLPPGTSDAPLTIMQILKPDGVVIVTTPQEVAVVDARKSARMAMKMEIPVIGIIENMTGDIFGTGGGEKAAGDLGVEFLGRVRLDKRISGSADKGKPFVLEESPVSGGFGDIVKKVKQYTDKK